MASGETLYAWTAHANEPTLTNYAVFNTRNGHLLLEFDAATAQSAMFGGVLPRNYAGGGVTVRLGWLGAAATTGDVKWNGAFERHQSGTDDLDSDSFAAAQTATGAAASTSGAVQYTDIAFTNGAQMDSLATGESFRLKVTRDAADSADTMFGYAQLLTIELRET
jgi:hypothetical protein